MGPATVALTSEDITRDGRFIGITRYTPSTTAVGHVVFAPGFQLDAAFYETWLTHLASWGFDVLALDLEGGPLTVNHVAMSLDMSAAIDHAGPDATGLPVVVAGHSLGGKVAFMTAFADDRAAAVLALDPVNGANPITGYSANLPDIVPDQVAPLTVPIALFGETTDAMVPGFGQACAPAAQNFQTFFDAATSSPLVYAWTVTGANHMDFLSDPEDCGFACGLCNDSTADVPAVQLALRERAAAFVLSAVAAIAPPPAVLASDDATITTQVGP